MESKILSFFDLYDPLTDALAGNLNGEQYAELLVLWERFVKEAPYAKLCSHSRLDPTLLASLKQNEVKLAFVLHSLENHWIVAPDSNNSNEADAKNYISFYKFLNSRSLIDLASHNFHKEGVYVRESWTSENIHDLSNEKAVLFKQLVSSRNAMAVEWSKKHLINIMASVPKTLKDKTTNYSYSIPWQLYLSEPLELTTCPEKGALIQELEALPDFNKNTLMLTAAKSYNTKLNRAPDDLLVKIIEDGSINTVSTFEDKKFAQSYLKLWDKRMGAGGLKSLVGRNNASMPLLTSIVEYCLAQRSEGTSVTSESILAWTVKMHKSMVKSPNYDDSDRFPDTQKASLRTWINAIEDVVQNDILLKNALCGEEMGFLQKFGHVLYLSYGVDESTLTSQNVKTRFLDPIIEASKNEKEAVFASFGMQGHHNAFRPYRPAEHQNSSLEISDILEQQAINSSFLMNDPRGYQNMKKKDAFLKLFTALNNKKAVSSLNERQKLEFRSILLSRTIAGKTDKSLLASIIGGKHALFKNDEDWQEVARITIESFVTNYPQKLAFKEKFGINSNYTESFLTSLRDVPSVMVGPFIAELINQSKKSAKHEGWVEGFNLQPCETMDRLFMLKDTNLELLIKNSILTNFKTVELWRDYIHHRIFTSASDIKDIAHSVVVDSFNNFVKTATKDEVKTFIQLLESQKEKQADAKKKNQMSVIDDVDFNKFISILEIGRIEQFQNREGAVIQKPKSRRTLNS